MVSSYFVHIHRTTASLDAVPRGTQLLQDGSRWPVDDVGKRMKALTDKLARADAARLCT